MERLDGVYVFGLPHSKLYLAPEIPALLLEEDAQLCIVRLRVGENDLRMEDGSKSVFVLNRKQYIITARRSQKADSLQLKYTLVRKDLPSCGYHSKESNPVSATDTFREWITVKLGEEFKIRSEETTGTGYVTNAVPSEGLEFVNKSVGKCNTPGCTSLITTTFRALEKGNHTVTIYKGRPWEDNPLERNTIHINVI